MTPLYEEFTGASSLPWQVMAIRLLGAVLLCGLIGFEREARGRPAGLRTHMLVGLAAALYCLVNAVTSGVAFLAAGMIVFSQGKVRGLTTGTSLWLAAAVGLSTGFGMWRMAGLATVFALVIIRVVKIMEDGAQNARNTTERRHD